LIMELKFCQPRFLWTVQSELKMTAPGSNPQGSPPNEVELVAILTPRSDLHSEPWVGIQYVLFKP
jgi:hypothetical protein